MLKTKYISNCTERDIDELKTAILFFDNVEIINNVFYHIDSNKIIQTTSSEEIEAYKLKKERNIDIADEGYQMGTIVGVIHSVTQKYLEQIDTLINEGIVTLSSDENKNKDNVWSKVDETVNSILSKDLSILYKESDIVKNEKGKRTGFKVILSDEARHIHEEFVGKLEVGSKMDLNFIDKYYSSLLSSLFLHISRGEQCITTSTSINKFLEQHSQNMDFREIYKTIRNEDINPNLAINAIKLAVPNISAFPFDEVLETREKASAELEKFRNELETLQFNLLENYSMAEIQIVSPEIVKHKINPSLVDLRRKIDTLDLKLPKKILEEFGDPKSYTPLLGTFMGAIPIYIASLLSFGLISASVAYDYMLERKDIKNNGLYYLIELNNKFG